MVKHEFNAKKHVRGVLSMARGGGSTPKEDEKFWDSASSQFFIMDGPNPALDGKYSAFGMLVDGFEALEKIANSPGKAGQDGTIRPAEPQKILSATVVRAPAKK
jgi:cyclophilin family peptidyl-prolyl cis-trans isomerase